MKEKRKLAVIGASYLQEPLIRKAQSMGLETHVFAWAANDVGERCADHFYPISIVEKDEILEKCAQLGIDGICSIASDLAMTTVNHVASRLGLTGNSPEATAVSTNKRLMRQAFRAHGVPSPLSLPVDAQTELSGLPIGFPAVVKPTDRSGSRGVSVVRSREELEAAVGLALEQSFEKKALVEEFVSGKEYSVECLSWRGEHQLLALTEKFTTGAPHFIETGHLQPADPRPASWDKLQSVVFQALDSLGLKYGASHTEVRIDGEGNIRLIEVGGRMGGDLIGSDLVELSTGVDFVRAVIEVALGRAPTVTRKPPRAAAVRFFLSPDDQAALERLRRQNPAYLVRADVRPIRAEVHDSSERFGYFLMTAASREALLPYLPENE